MHVPFGIPFAAPNAPCTGIRFHLIALFRRQRRQAGLEELQHILRLHAACGGIQSALNHADHRVALHGVGAGHIERNPKPVEYILQHRPVGGHIGTADGHIPVAPALAGQILHSSGHIHAGFKHTAGTVQMQRRNGAFPWTGSPAEQIIRQMTQGGRTAICTVQAYRATFLRCYLPQPQQGPSCHRKRPGCGTIGQQGHSDAVRLFQNSMENLHLNGR